MPEPNFALRFLRKHFKVHILLLCHELPLLNMSSVSNRMWWQHCCYTYNGLVIHKTGQSFLESKWQNILFQTPEKYQSSRTYNRLVYCRFQRNITLECDRQFIIDSIDWSVYSRNQKNITGRPHNRPVNSRFNTTDYDRQINSIIQRNSNRVSQATGQSDLEPREILVEHTADQSFQDQFERQSIETRKTSIQ